MSVVWHDLECGSYAEDLALWRSLAAEHAGAILDIGAGTGRTTLDLASQGHHVTALDRDADLLDELARRAAALDVDVVVADARAFELERRFALCIVPMQTIQLLGGREGRRRFLRCARAVLDPGGMLAVAISARLDLFDLASGSTPPLPDICERDGIVYSSQPTAVRAEQTGFVLERLREIVSTQGEREVTHDSVRLDSLSVEQLQQEGREAGFEVAGRAEIPATADYVGSEVVMLRA